MANEKIITLDNLTAYNDKIQNKITDIDTRLSRLETSPKNVLWVGTSIPAGNVVDGVPNNYPQMVADALGFKLYNN